MPKTNIEQLKDIWKHKHLMSLGGCTTDCDCEYCIGRKQIIDSLIDQAVTLAIQARNEEVVELCRKKEILELCEDTNTDLYEREVGYNQALIDIINLISPGRK